MKEVYIFGRGKYYKVKKESIEERYKIVGFLDNAVDVNETEWEDNKPVFHPSYVKGREETNVLLTSTDLVTMFYQLKKYNVSDERIFFSYQLAPVFDLIDRELSCKENKLEVKSGELFLTIQGECQIIETQVDLKKQILNSYMKSDIVFQLIQELKTEPISRRFGRELGTPIDRIYIEKFLESNQSYIKGNVIEVGDDYYTRKYGVPNVKSNIMHIYGWKGAKKINIETGEGIEENSIDCFICTQTLQMIYDIHACMKNIKKMLKPDGVALITISGISQLAMSDYSTWGEYWRVTPLTAKKLATEQFGNENVQVYSYGNVKTVAAFICSIPAEVLDPRDFEENDEQFPLTVGLVVKK